MSFIQRNPLLLIAILLLAIFAPSVLGGIALFFLYVILGIVALGVFLTLSLRWRLRRLQREAGEAFGSEQNRREGEVKVHNLYGAGEKRVRRDVGDYVEFEEVEIEEEIVVEEAITEE